MHVSPGFFLRAEAASTSSGCRWHKVPHSWQESAPTQSSQTAAGTKTNMSVTVTLCFWFNGTPSPPNLTLRRSLPRASTKSHWCSSNIWTKASSCASLKLSARVRPYWKAVLALFIRSLHSIGYVFEHGSPSRVLKYSTLADHQPKHLPKYNNTIANTVLPAGDAAIPLTGLTCPEFSTHAYPSHKSLPFCSWMSSEVYAPSE